MGGFRGGEPELAIAMAGRAAGMLVIMDRGFPGVALWKRVYAGRSTSADPGTVERGHAARSKILDDGTYLARMNLAGQKRRASRRGSW